jgi:hypothetical protein
MNPTNSAPDVAVAATSRRPRASVVMTVHHDLRFLDAAVESVLSQQFRDFEFIIVDDGTGQEAIFDALAERDPASGSSSTRPISVQPRRQTAASTTRARTSSFVSMPMTLLNRRLSVASWPPSMRIRSLGWSEAR